SRFFPAVLQLVLFTGGFIGQAFSGVFMSAFGFIRPYVGILLCFLASFFYCLLVVPESLELPNQPGTLTSLFNIQSLKRVFTVFTTPRPSTKRRNLIILVLIDSLFYCISVGANGVLILYLLRSPVCLSSTGLGAFFAFKFVTEGLGGIVGVVVLRKFLREENVYRVGFVSLGLGFLCLALVQNQYMAFLVPVFSSMSGILMPSLKGAIANLVKAEEQGATNTAVSVVENISLIFGSLACNTMYIYASASGFPYMVFIVCGVVALTPILIIR
ncbi:hypothetical protein QZH41_020149, partial [Actinostola sp. cb2023]